MADPMPNQMVEEILHSQGDMESDRAPWEAVWREVDERVNPLGQGGFTKLAPGNLRGLDIFDHTASLGLDRFTAAITGMIIPRGERYHQLTTTDASLNQDAEVVRWLETANDLLFAMRYAPFARFDPEANMNIRSLGSYGSAPFLVMEEPGVGVYYKSLHLSECFIQEDFRGQVDTVHRKYELTLRQCVQDFGEANLTPKMAEALTKKMWNATFCILHVVRPRKDRDPKRLDFRRMRYQSVYVAYDEKLVIREGGFESMPICVSRYVTGPRERYGRSPAIQVLGSIRTINEMAKTLLRAGHKAVDPPLLIAYDGALGRVATKPGGLTVGGLDFNGSPQVVPLQSGGNLPIGMELLNNEREPVRDAFLEKVWSLVMDRRDRMTATEVLEISRMQGMLMAPMSSRLESEWLAIQIARELEIGLRSGYIKQPPPQLAEAGAGVKIQYDNPLSRAAKAEEALGFGRWLETLQPLAALDESVYDVVDLVNAPRELATAFAVRSRYLATPEAVEEKRAAREEEKAAALSMEAMVQGSEAMKNMASARGQETAYAA